MDPDLLQDNVPVPRLPERRRRVGRAARAAVRLHNVHEIRKDLGDLLRRLIADPPGVVGLAADRDHVAQHVHVPDPVFCIDLVDSQLQFEGADADRRESPACHAASFIPLFSLPPGPADE